MNFLKIVKTGACLTFGEGQSTPALKRCAELPGGCYRVGFRPNYLDGAAYSGCG